MAREQGITRNVDDLGRIVIPKEYRDVLGIPAGTPVEILLKGETVLISKHSDHCAHCGGTENCQQIGNALICADCIAKTK